jgi:hypothetical protein
MSDTPFVLGANGMIANVNWAPEGYQNGHGNIDSGYDPNATPAVPAATSGPGPWAVVQQLKGGDIMLRGAGEYDFPSTSRSPQLALGQGSETFVSGTRGSFQVDFIAGTNVGDNEGLAFLVGNVSPAPTQYLGLSLATASNTPTIKITDSTGAVVITATAAATVIAAGTYVQARVYWDSALGTVALYINGVAQVLTYTATPWTPFVPIATLYGNVPTTFASLTAAFTGKFGTLQVSPNATP